MPGSNYWNGDTSLLFGVENQALVSSRCSPETSCWGSSLNGITSKRCLVLRRGWAQRLGPKDGYKRSPCDRRHGLSLREGSKLLDIERWILFSCCRAEFIPFPGQISRLPAQYKIGGQPSKITKLQVLLRKGFHLQARPDDSHGRSAK
jgi:hypothetical protein